MDATTIKDLIIEAIDFYQEEEESDEIVRMTSYREAGVLTDDEGIILKTKDGREIYLTIQDRTY